MAEGTAEKRAPVQGYTPGIPWEMHLRAYDAYRKKYGAQPALIDLEGRSCRGGFGTGELDEFIPGWREELSERKAVQDEITSLRAQLAEARAALKAEREACAKIADEWSSFDTMQLRAGEMTAQEKRSVRAVVTAIAMAIRARKTEGE